MVLVLGSLWVNGRILPGIRFYSPVSLLGNAAVLVASVAVFLFVRGVLRGSLRAGRPPAVASGVTGLTVFFWFLCWRGGLVLETASTEVGGLKLAALIVGIVAEGCVVGAGVGLLCSLVVAGHATLRATGRGFLREGRSWLVLLGLGVVVLFAAALFSRTTHGRPDSAGRIEVTRGEGKGVNIILIVVDALRPDRLSCYGNRRLTSPTLDSLAECGTKFEEVICTAPFTWPAMSSLFTSLYPPYHGVRTHADSLRSSLTTLAEILSACGYHTGAISSHRLLTRELGYGQGFDDFQVSDQSFGGALGNLLLFEIVSRLAPAPLGEDAPAITDRVLKWLPAQKNRPFFLWVHYADVHGPYHPPQEYVQRFRPAGKETAASGREKELRDLLASQKVRSLEDMMRLGKTITPEVLGYYAILYDASVAFVDAQIARIAARIRDLGLAGKTLVVITSDHGQSLGEHGQIFIAHGPLLYDNTIKTPLILSCPGVIPGGGIVPTQASGIDVMPTLLELAGVRFAGEMQGRSFASAVRDSLTLPPREAYVEGEMCWRGREIYFLGRDGRKDYFTGIQGKRRAIRTSEWKLIYTPKQGDHLFELYDLRRDPRELQNLYLTDRAVAESLKKKLVDWMVGAEQGPPVDGAPSFDDQTRSKLRALGYVE
jgi:arylsulfatase A-like enzyme